MCQQNRIKTRRIVGFNHLVFRFRQLRASRPFLKFNECRCQVARAGFLSLLPQRPAGSETGRFVSIPGRSGVLTLCRHFNSCAGMLSVHASCFMKQMLSDSSTSISVPFSPFSFTQLHGTIPSWVYRKRACLVFTLFSLAVSRCMGAAMFCFG